MSGIKEFSMENRTDKKDKLDLLTLVESTVAEPYTGAGSYTKGFLFAYGRISLVQESGRPRKCRSVSVDVYVL